MPYQIHLTWFEETRDEKVGNYELYNAFKQNVSEWFSIDSEYRNYLDILVEHNRQSYSLNNVSQTQTKPEWVITMKDCFTSIGIPPNSKINAYVQTERKELLTEGVKLRREYQEALYWVERQRSHRDEFSARYPHLDPSFIYGINMVQPYGPLEWYIVNAKNLALLTERKRKSIEDSERLFTPRAEQKQRQPPPPAAEEKQPQESSTAYSHSYTSSPIRTEIHRPPEVEEEEEEEQKYSPLFPPRTTLFQSRNAGVQPQYASTPATLKIQQDRATRAKAAHERTKAHLAAQAARAQKIADDAKARRQTWEEKKRKDRADAEALEQKYEEDAKKWKEATFGKNSYIPPLPPPRTQPKKFQQKENIPIDELKASTVEKLQNAFLNWRRTTNLSEDNRVQLTRRMFGQIFHVDRCPDTYTVQKLQEVRKQRVPENLMEKDYASRQLFDRVVHIVENTKSFEKADCAEVAKFIFALEEQYQKYLLEH
jgi:hypothetical protein